jgi:hypothetical protein
MEENDGGQLVVAWFWNAKLTSDSYRLPRYPTS